MQHRYHLQETLLKVILTWCIFFAIFLFYFITKNPIQNNFALLSENSINLLKPEKVSVALPVRLKIPNINVDANIISVGVTPLGAMDVPKGPDDVAWFNLGPRPGQQGSAVISGHYGTWKNGSGSVFDNLNKLERGDRLSIEDEEGVITNFIVRDIRTYNPDANAQDIFVSSDGKSHLNLITCEGVWDNIQKTYSERLVVFADKE